MTVTRPLLILVPALLLGCASPPARETLPVVHVICLGQQGQPIIDSFMTRQQFEKLAFTAAVPCVFEWGEAMPGVPIPTPTSTGSMSPSPTPSPEPTPARPPA